MTSDDLSVTEFDDDSDEDFEILNESNINVKDSDEMNA